MKKIILLLMLCGVFTGCNQFLNVRPDDEAFEEEIFLKPEGFTKALGGVYKHLVSNSLYGKEMKFGMMDMMMGYWSHALTDELSVNLKKFNFEYSLIRFTTEQMYGGLYNAIHQTNIILTNLPKLEGKSEYNLVAGEAYGLRAFLHLELLKYYGPVLKEEGVQSMAVPYYLEPTKTPQPKLSSSTVLESIERDLQTALAFLKDDPIQRLGRAADGNDATVGSYSALIDRRGIRMNYYAVKALLARKSQWEGNSKAAYERAIELIHEVQNSQAIRFIKAADIQRNRPSDYRFSCENFWGLYNNDALATFTTYFLNNTLKVDYDEFLKPLYEAGNLADDIRINWGLGGYTFPYFNKFNNIESDASVTANQGNPNAFEIKMITLPEMYFIAAESVLADNPTEALRLLNEFRKGRDLNTDLLLTDPVQIEEAIVEEVRKDFIGDGYLYSFYKRRYQAVPSRTGPIGPTLAMYIFPLPTNEQIYNQ